MKTKIAFLNLLVALLCCSNKSSAQIDLVPGINYSYNPPGANGIIQIVNMDVCNNGPSSAGSFDVALYIYNVNTHNAYVVGDTIISGINGSACITIYNWNVNINNTPGIPAGTYQPGEWVNSKQMVTESDTTNNAGLFSGSWTYTPTGINEVSLNTASINIFPNPGEGKYTVQCRVGNESEVLYLYNTLGEMVRSVPINSAETQLDLTDQTKGVYIFKLLNSRGAFITSGKLIQQ